MSLPLLLPLLLGAQAPGGLDTPITYNEPAKLASAVFAEIDKKYGVNLKANPDTDREVLLVSVNNLPLKGLMDKIAFVTSCTWESSGDKYTLVPARGQWNKEENDEAEQRTKTIQDLVQQKVKELKKKQATEAKAGENSDQAAADAMSAAFGGGGGPEEAVIIAMLQLIDPAQLSQVHEGARGVWVTNNANQTQIGLNGELQEAIHNWVQAHNDAIPKGAENANAAENAGLPKPMLDMMKSTMTPVTDPVYKVLLIAEPVSIFGQDQLKLKAFNRDGKVILAGQSSLGANIMELAKQIEDAKKQTKPEDAGTPIDFSEDSKELRGASGTSQMMMEGRHEIPANLKAKMSHPDQYDPLGFFVTDIYRSVAKKRNLQIVADLPDTAYGSGGLQDQTAPPKTVEAAEAQMKTGKAVLGVEEDGFLYVKPAYPAESRAHRLDRVALARLIDAAQTKLMPSLDDIADYAVVNEDPTKSAIGQAYTAAFVPNVFSGMMLNGGQTGWGLYRIFGGLSENERKTLRSGGRLPFSTLSGQEQGFLTSYLFGPEAEIGAEGAKDQMDFITKMTSKFMPGARGDYRDEATEVMPNGLPQDGYLSCAASSEPIAFMNSGAGMFANWSFGPKELALFKMFSSGPAAAQAGVSLPKEGLIGERQKLDLSFHLAPKIAATGELLDPIVDKNGAPSKLSNLPTDFQARVDAEADALKKSTWGALIEMGLNSQGRSVGQP